jgi:hypothetical protein
MPRAGHWVLRERRVRCVDPLDDLRSKIESFGWAVGSVASAEPAECVSYTVGLTSHGHPEGAITGLPSDVGRAFLNIVGEVVVREGGRFTAGEPISELSDGPPLPIIEVDDTSNFTAIGALYGEVKCAADRLDRLCGHLAMGRELRESPRSPS